MATTITTTTITTFEQTSDLLDKAFDQIFDLAVYARTSDLRPHTENCPNELECECVGTRQTYKDNSLALAHISQIENAILIIRDNSQLLRKALGELAVNAGVEFDDYADDTLRTY